MKLSLLQMNMESCASRCSKARWSVSYLVQETDKAAESNHISTIFKARQQEFTQRTIKLIERLRKICLQTDDCLLYLNILSIYKHFSVMFILAIPQVNSYLKIGIC